MSGSEFRYVTTNLYQSGGTANPIISELPFTGVSFTSQLNSIGTFQGHVLLSGINSSQANAYVGTIPGKTILWVLYTDPVSLVSTPVWSGVIWQRDYDSSSQRLSITAQEMMSLYNRRRISTTKDYSVNPSDPLGYDPAYIAYQLMLYAEALPHGNTGLTYNSITTAYRTKKLYEGYELKQVYQAIKDLAANFADFKVEPLVVSGNLINKFTLGDPLGTTYSTSSLVAPVLQFPGNLVKYTFPEDASGAANKLYGLGYGANNSKIIAIAIDPTKITSGDWPLLEDSTNYIDIGDLQLLKDLTLGQLKAISYPPTTVEVIIPPYVDPYYPSYKIGDQVQLRITDDYFPSTVDPYYETMRIVAINVNPGENGPSQITLTLTRLLGAGTVS
jgi:hypothetical protein